MGQRRRVRPQAVEGIVVCNGIPAGFGLYVPGSSARVTTFESGDKPWEVPTDSLTPGATRGLLGVLLVAVVTCFVLYMDFPEPSCSEDPSWKMFRSIAMCLIESQAVV